MGMGFGSGWDEDAEREERRTQIRAPRSAAADNWEGRIGGPFSSFQDGPVDFPAPQQDFKTTAAKPLAAHKRYTAMYGLWRSLWSRHEEEADIQNAFSDAIEFWEDQQDVAQLQTQVAEFIRRETEFKRHRRDVVLALFFPVSSSAMVANLYRHGLGKDVDPNSSYTEKLLIYAHGLKAVPWNEREARTFLEITRNPAAASRPDLRP